MTQTDDTARLGNTRAKRARCYILTIFNDDIKHFEKATFEIWCDDTCKDGKPHKHHVIYFKNPISFNTIKKQYPTAHIEAAKNIYDAIGYIKNNKNGRKTNIEFLGEEPKDTRFKTVGELKECKDVNELDWKQYNTWQKIHEKEANDLDIDDWQKSVKVYYIQGPSGSGKTEKAKEIVRQNIDKYGRKINRVKCENNYWIGVGEEAKIAIYDDFRDSHMKASEFVNFIDYNKQIMNIKGGSKINNYELIIITSVQNINEIYKSCHGEPRKQWMRRIEVINIEDNDEDIDVDWI